MDAKIIIGLFADILYMRGLLCFDEMESLLDIKNESDVFAFSERLLRGDFNAYKRGEIYSESIARTAE